MGASWVHYDERPLDDAHNVAEREQWHLRQVGYCMASIIVLIIVMHSAPSVNIVPVMGPDFHMLTKSTAVNLTSAMHVFFLLASA